MNNANNIDKMALVVPNDTIPNTTECKIYKEIQMTTLRL